MANYEDRPSLPPGSQQSQTSNSRFENDVYREDIPGSDETEAGHLLVPHDENGLAEPKTLPTRRIGWTFAVLLVFSAIAALSLSGLLLSLESPQPNYESQEIDHSPPPQPGDRYLLDPNWDFSAPNQTRRHIWTITDGEASPDGVRRPVMLINGQFPGPLIEMNEGDTLLVNVRNEASNATALHWHGIFQNGTNWMDGAAGVTQCPIAPGQTFNYFFKVTGQSGTYFYHGHQGVQMLDGLVGPIVVHNRREAVRPYSSDRVMLLQDWWYEPASGLMRHVLSPGVEDVPNPNTALLNGINQAVCSDHPDRKCTAVEARSLPHLEVKSGERHRIRFINVGGYSWFQVAVDGHNDLQVVEVDGTIVEPVLGSPLVLSPGQRYSAVLTADHDEGAFWLRAKMITACFADQRLPEEGIDEAKAIVRYTSNLESRHGDHDDSDLEENHNQDENKQEFILPETSSELPFLTVCRDMSSTTSFQPSPQLPAPSVADQSWYLRVNLAIGDWRLQRGVLNSSSFRPNLKYPTLHRVIDGLLQNNESFNMNGINTAAFDAESELVISNDKIETVDLILQNIDEHNHPFHLHGTKVWVLGAGHGYFPGYEALGFSPEGKGLLDPANKTVIANPLKRDVVTVEGFGWTLLRFVADNPGVWLFHCHVIWHSEAGMGMQFISRLDILRRFESLPKEGLKLCDAPEEQLIKGAPPKDDIFFGSGINKR
ncbi:multicopper oxidase-domain-containing protein [Nemania sp. FL0916]|nr:multicopper oxidase-domain-containing protein [Nemania sp. FL0916]